MSRKVLYREYDNEGNLIKKECSKCGEIKTLNNFQKDKSTKDGFMNFCKKCKGVKNYKRILFREYNEDGNLIRLECRKCREIKGIENFSHDKKSINGIKTLCKSCDEKYRCENKDKFKEWQKQHYTKNKEFISKQHREQRNNKAQQEILKIYKNVTKQLYPHNGIQYGIIYGVHCISTDRWYIGQTRRSFNTRYLGDFFKYKFYYLSEDNTKEKLFQHDIQKYGQENFEILEVIDVAFSEKELDEKEVYYIDYYKAYNEGYNSQRGNIFKHDKSKRKEVI